MTYLDAIRELQQRGIEALKVAQSTQVASLSATRDLAAMFGIRPRGTLSAPALNAVNELTSFAFAMLEQQVAYAEKLADLLGTTCAATTAESAHGTNDVPATREPVVAAHAIAESAVSEPVSTPVIEAVAPSLAAPAPPIVEAAAPPPTVAPKPPHIEAVAPSLAAPAPPVVEAAVPPPTVAPKPPHLEAAAPTPKIAPSERVASVSSEPTVKASVAPTVPTAKPIVPKRPVPAAPTASNHKMPPKGPARKKR